MAPSNGIRLRHVWMAAKTAGMEVTLRQEADEVIFQVAFEVPIRRHTQPDAAEPPIESDKDRTINEAELAKFPHGLSIFCIDDSQVSQRVLVHNLSSRAAPAEVQSFGESPADVPVFINLVLERGHIAILDQNLDWPQVVSLNGPFAQPAPGQVRS